MKQDHNTKQISLTEVRMDLQSGLTRWKKDDIGFGSLEKKYNLTISEAIELFNHPKIKDVVSKIPTFVIVDDIPDEVEEEQQERVGNIEVGSPIFKQEPAPKVAYVKAVRPQVEEEEQEIVAFI